MFWIISLNAFREFHPSIQTRSSILQTSFIQLVGFFRTKSSFGKLPTSLSNTLLSIKDKVKILCPITQPVVLAVIKKIAEVFFVLRDRVHSRWSDRQNHAYFWILQIFSNPQPRRTVR